MLRIYSTWKLRKHCAGSCNSATSRRLVQLGDLTPARAQEALDDHAALVVDRHAHRELLPRIWQLRESISAYDAAYVALAEALEAPLLTCDAKLARSHGHRAKMALVE